MYHKLIHKKGWNYRQKEIKRSDRETSTGVIKIEIVKRHAERRYKKTEIDRENTY